MKLLALLSISALLFASDEMKALLDDLNGELNNASEISTKTKLNINKTPAVVSVLHADELKKFGFTTVYEALEAVPGIEISMGLGGGKQINMRGNKSIVTDKLKFMVDGVAINAELSGANLFYLNFPLENVERIEVIRGPASALYGSFAHIGLINVITKASLHKESVLFVRGSSLGSKNVGFTQQINKEDLKVALTGSFEGNEQSRTYDNYSLLPGREFESHEDFTNRTLGINIELYKELSFQSKYLELDMQNHFGYGAWPIVQDPKKLKHTSWINELRYTPKLSKTVGLDLKLGYKEYGFSGYSRAVPYSILIPTSKDFIAGGVYKEKTYYTDLAMNYTDDVHALTLGTYLGQTDVKNPSYLQNAILPVYAPILSEATTISIDGGGLIDKIERKQHAFYVSDVITLSSQWMANLGLRYDEYSDVDSALSPKASLLYMADERQSYKLMYQNSFRAPTFIEKYGTIAPNGGEVERPETIDTLELAYSFEQGYSQWLNLNFFYSKMKDFTYRDTDLRLKNGPDASAYGTEFEFKIPLCSVSTLQANYSYVLSKDENGLQVPLMANHLANAMLSYQLNRDWHTGSRLRYVGERRREATDTREALNGYATFDQTLTFNYDAFVFQASVKNIFNADVRYISPKANELSSGTYLDDLERNGRVFWLSAEWKFE